MRKGTLMSAVIAGLAVGLGSAAATFADEPEGKIVFSSYRTGNAEIWIMDADGSNQTRITDHAAFDGCPALSPDGSRIAFTSTRASANERLYVMDVDGSDVQEIAAVSGQNCQFPSWTPDGTRVMATANIGSSTGTLFIVDADGDNYEVLRTGYVGRPFQNPAGSKIVFDQRTSGISYSHQMFLMNSDGSGAVQLTSGAASESTICGSGGYSPDGSLISFTRGHALWLMDSDGTDQHLVLGDSPISGRYEFCSISPDGEWILFSRDPGTGNTDIYRCRLDGTDVTRLTTDASYDNFPRWGPSWDGTPPVAVLEAEASYEATETGGVSFTLYGDDSYDPEGNPLTFTWYVNGTVVQTGLSDSLVRSYALGTHTVALVVNDGTHDSEAAEVEFDVVDTTAPALTVPAAVTVECSGPSGQAVSIGTATATDICDANPVVTSDAPALFGLGTTTVTWTAKDASGNTATGTQTVTVIDTTPPVLTVPAAVTVECTGPAGQAVSIGAATATDICDANPVVTSDAPALFGLGTTTVTWSGKDASGNTATGTQTVTVVDTTKPSVSVSGLPGEVWPPNHGMVRLQPTLTVSDVADVSPAVTLSVVSNEADDGLGDGDTAGDIVVHSPTDVEVRAERSGKGNGRTYTLTWTVTDASGNAAVLTAEVTVPKSQGK